MKEGICPSLQGLSLVITCGPLALETPCQITYFGHPFKKFDNMFIMIQRLFLAFEKSICLG